MITWFRADVDLPKKFFYGKVLFFTQLSYQLMCKLLKKSYMLSSTYLLHVHTYITRIKKGCYGKSGSLVRSSTLLSRETNNKRTLVLMGYLFTHSISWLNVWVQGDLCDSLGTNCVYCIPCKWFLDEMFYFVTWNWLAYVQHTCKIFREGVY